MAPKTRTRVSKDEAVYAIINFIQENEITYVDKSWVCVGEEQVHWPANGKAAKRTANPFPGGGGWIQRDIEVLGYARKLPFTGLQPGSVLRFHANLLKTALKHSSHALTETHFFQNQRNIKEPYALTIFMFVCVFASFPL